MQIYLDNIGCRLNWSEIEALARELTSRGHTIVARAAEADVMVVNTCAVTAQAERKTRHCIRSLHRENPEARLAVIGCYATLRPDLSAVLPGVSWVIPNAEKECTADILTGEPALSPLSQETDDHIDMLRTRAFVKVQDGCDNRCTYCIIRSLRGSSRSRPLDDILREIQALIEKASCREAVLTGASLGAYGRDWGLSGGLRTLIEAILHKTDLARLRVSSLEPWDLDEGFFTLWEDPRLCRQIHLPLQSGCNATLRRMGRPITTDTFARLVEAARRTVPDVAITTDVLVGFPGEHEEEFHQSYSFVKRMAFAKLHVFPYSARPKTPATNLPDRVPRRVRDERTQRMRALGAEQRRDFQRRFLNRELPVLWEKQWQDGRWAGWTDNYIRVVARAEGDRQGSCLDNQLTLARLIELQNGYVEGEVLS